MQSKWLWGLLVVSLAIIVVSYTYFTEEYETQIWTGESQAAKRNPYLGAQRFLEGRGVTVITATEQLDFESIPISDSVFLSKVDSMLVSKSQVDAALDWVERGGYLLVGVSAEVEGYASILKEFDVEPEYQNIDIEQAFLGDDGEPMTASDRMSEINKQIEDRQAENEKQEPDDRDKAAERPTSFNEGDNFSEQLFDLLNIDFAHEFYKISLNELDDELHLAVLDRIILSHPDVYGDPEQEVSGVYELLSWVADENGERLLQFGYGQGTFTALSSTKLWENSNLGLGDHAYFLSYMVPDDSTLHLFYDISAPSIGSLLDRYFHEAIWSALVLLALWLWQQGIRVQRVVGVVEGQRRNFAEHLSSSANFLVVNKQFVALLQPVKEDIEHQMSAFYPRFSQLNQQSQVAMLVDRTHIPEQTLQDWARYCHRVETQHELLAALKIGNAIRKKL